jgi:hypothetical protein
MIYRLIVLNGLRKGERITIDPEPTTLGQGDDCGIRLEDNEVALHHAELTQRDAELFIRDLGSMNKVIVNKREVQETRLKHGDILELGRTRLLVQAIVQAEVQNPPAPAIQLTRRHRKRRYLAAAAALTLVALGTLALRHEPEAVPEPAPLTELAPEPAPTLTPVAATPTPPTPESTEDLRRIREDLAVIQQHLSQVNQIAPPPAAPAPAAPIAPVDDLQAITRAVRDAMTAEDFAQADTLLEHLQLEYPDYLPAYQLRAELFEAWGMPAKARDQWTAVLQRTTESDLYRRAVIERIRLARADSQRQIGAHEAMRIKGIEQIRFRESEQYDEMRTVTIQLHYNRDLGPIDPAAVKLTLYFFEQDLDTDQVALSAAQPSSEAILTDLSNDALDQFTASVSYIVPKGYYTRDHNTSRQRYFGFIARLHYFERLVDEQARPSKLLEPAVLEAAGLADQAVAAETGTEALLFPARN